MDHTQAIALCRALSAEAAECNTGWTFEVVEAHNTSRNVPPQAIVYAVAGQDEDGTPQTLWVSPDLSFPTLF